MSALERLLNVPLADLEGLRRGELAELADEILYELRALAPLDNEESGLVAEAHRATSRLKRYYAREGSWT